MPRKSRIGAPGALHHIIARGIERRAIFRDDRDRDSFLERLGNNLMEIRTPCYAWALLRNHFHLLLRSVGGWSAVKDLWKMGAYQKGDERKKYPKRLAPRALLSARNI